MPVRNAMQSFIWKTDAVGPWKSSRVVMNETCSPIRENGLGIGVEYAAGHIEHLTGGD